MPDEHPRFLPFDPGTVLVHSFSTAGDYHIVDFWEMTCSCSYFNDERKHPCGPTCRHIEAVLFAIHQHRSK